MLEFLVVCESRSRLREEGVGCGRLLVRGLSKGTEVLIRSMGPVVVSRTLLGMMSVLLSLLEKAVILESKSAIRPSWAFKFELIRSNTTKILDSSVLLSEVSLSGESGVPI
jgi:hypothetical protein